MVLNDNETLDDLENGYYLIQRRDGFRFGIDAVLLADFAKCRAKRVIDLCTGTGIVAILLAAKTDIAQIDAVELQPEMAELASRSVSYNKLEGRVHVRCADLKNAPELYGKSLFDAVTVNPPYMKSGAGLINEDRMKLLSRHEIGCTLDDVVRVSSELLKTHGKLFMVHRPQRLADVMFAMRSWRIEPKRMRFVAPKQGREANLVLIEGVKNANSELKLMPTLYVYDDDGAYTKEIDVIYGR